MRGLGIDIGTTNIKVVELSGSLDEIKLENYGILETYGYLERPNAAIQTSYFKIVEEITTDLLKKLFLTLKPKTKRAALSLPIFSSFVTTIELPLIEEKELKQAIPFEVRKYIPLPLEDVEIDWTVISQELKEEKVPRSQILLIALPKELIEKYKRIAKNLGLDLVALELESLALLRSLIDKKDSPILVIDIGTQSSNIIIFDRGFLVSNENLNVGGAELTHLVAQGLGISQERAEEFKRLKGLKVEPQEMEIVNLLMPMLDYFANEIKRAIDLYKEKSQRNIEKIILAGGTANFPGLEEYFQQLLNLKVERAWPFEKIKYQSFLTPLLKESGPLLAIATGLAMRAIL